MKIQVSFQWLAARYQGSDGVRTASSELLMPPGHLTLTFQMSLRPMIIECGVRVETVIHISWLDLGNHSIRFHLPPASPGPDYQNQLHHTLHHVRRRNREDATAVNVNVADAGRLIVAAPVSPLN